MREAMLFNIAHLAWMTSVVRYLWKVSGSAERPAVSCRGGRWGRGRGEKDSSKKHEPSGDRQKKTEHVRSEQKIAVSCTYPAVVTGELAGQVGRGVGCEAEIGDVSDRALEETHQIVHSKQEEVIRRDMK